MRVHKGNSQLLVLILAVGFFIGIIYENLISKNGAITVELFRKSNLERYLQTKIIAEEYLWYVVKSRVLMLGILCILSCVKWKKILVVLCVGMLGVISGILAVSAVLQLGMKGILLCMAGILPQGIFYGMVYGMLLIYWFRHPERQWNRAKTVFVVLMFLVGMLLEAYVNPVIVKGIIRML